MITTQSEKHPDNTKTDESTICTHKQGELSNKSTECDEKFVNALDDSKSDLKIVSTPIASTLIQSHINYRNLLKDEMQKTLASIQESIQTPGTSICNLMTQLSEAVTVFSAG